MIRLVHLLFVLLVVSVAVAGSPTDQSASESESGRHSLQEILKHVDEAKIHDALHMLSDKFRHGVFPTDTNALEALHKEDASLGARLLKIARRQSPGNSTSSPVPSPVPSDSSDSATQVPSTSSIDAVPPETTATDATTEPTPSQTTPTGTTPTGTTDRKSVV